MVGLIAFLSAHIVVGIIIGAIALHTGLTDKEYNRFREPWT